MYRGLATPFVIEAHGPTGGLATSLDRLSAGLLGTLSLGTLLMLLSLGSRFLPSFSLSPPPSSFGRALTHRLTGTTPATIYIYIYIYSSLAFFPTEAATDTVVEHRDTGHRSYGPCPDSG